MASVDSGVDTGNDSNDSFAQDKNSVTQNEIQPNSSCGSSVVNADFVATSDGKVNKQCILFQLYVIYSDDGGSTETRVSKIKIKVTQFKKKRFKPLHIDPPAGLSFLNVQPISLSRGYEVAFQRFNAEYQRSRLINKMKHDHLKSLKHFNICQSDRFPTRRHIFRRGKTWLDFTRQRDENRLRLAAFMNDANKVREFLEAGVDPNCPDYQFRTPLHLSACNGYTEIVGLLLEHGADPNVKDMVGNTPLHLAVCTNHIDVVTLLLKGGTDASCYNVTGRSPLQLAQSKLKIIQRCEDSEYKHQVTSQVIEMLLTFIKKKTEVSKNAVDEELLNAFQSRLQVSETQEQVENELQNLLDNLSSLSLTNSPTSTITTNDQSTVSTISTITPSI